MAKLILEDGTTFEGSAFGAGTHAQGEVVFNTGMVGYPQSLTDPSYRGQILVFTYPLIGNYGVPGDEKDEYKLPRHFESSAIHVRGVVVSEYSKNAFHWESRRTLDAWLKQNSVPGISGIDTRALTKKLRQHGVMLGQMPGNENTPFATLDDPNKDNLVAEVSVKKPTVYRPGQRGKKFNARTKKSAASGKTLVVIDCGMKYNILRELLDRGITVIRVPWNYNFFELKEKFDGVFISNGPGDPMMARETVHLVRQAMDKKIPTLGICLGIQIMALAAGAKTYKLKFGHRAQNQPVIDVQGKCFLTSQNHGFSVDEKTLPKGWSVWMKNINDNTVEGIRHESLPFLAVQFHPESTPGPMDSNHLFDEFLSVL